MTAPRRPSWSVMIPTFEPRRGYLAATVASVLEQDWDGAEVQIEIVDDASDGFDVAAFVRDLGHPAVAAHRQPARRGIGGNWNTCIERARGEWVHILHQDDIVHAGFYRCLEEGIAREPELGAAFCRGHVIDPEGVPLRYTCAIDQDAPGVLGDWVQHVFVELAIQTPTIVVRRSVYQELGGFDTRLRFTLDWEMWRRIAARHPLWFDPRPLASFRVHEGSATRRLQRTGDDLVEVRRSIEGSARLLPDDVAPAAVRKALDHYTENALRDAWSALVADRDPGLARVRLRGAWGLSSPPALLRAAATLARNALVQASRRIRGRPAVDRPVPHP